MFDIFLGLLDAEKNKTSVVLIHRLLNGSRWMNSHATKTLDGFFEIRVEEGYGARWSMDGSKVSSIHLILSH